MGTQRQSEPTAGDGYWLNSSISRRSFLRTAVAGAVAVPTIGLLAACDDEGDDEEVTAADDDVTDDPTDDSDADAGDTDDSPAGGPNRGGTVRVGTSGSANTFHPYLQVTVEEGLPIQEMFSGLARQGLDLEPEPDLALSWEANEEGDQWTFTLRNDVLFHNGREMTAEDVVESYNYLLDPELGSQYGDLFSMIQEVEVVDEETVVFHLDPPYAGFVELQTNYYSKIIPIEEKDSLDTNPVGTGAFMFDRHLPGERTILRRFEDYFDTENEGFVDEVQYIHMPEETSRITALTGGDLDLLIDVAPTSVPMLEGSQEVIFEDVLSGAHITVIMTYTEEPWSDVRVRQALKATLDRQQIVDAAVQGYGVPAADQGVSPIDTMYPELPIPEQDTERSRQLLEEAGYPDGISAELHTSPGRVGLQETALAVQQMAEEGGFDIEVISHPIDQYWSEIWMQVPFHLSNWFSTLPSDLLLQLCYMTGGAWNESYWTNDEFDETLRQAQQAMDPDERWELMRQACEILAEEGAVSIPLFRSGIDAHHTRLHGYNPHPSRISSELHAVWLEDA